ncbi:heavy-metal-associated domain-containing protein [Paenibacillus yanchengensis]|uniref:Heavy-metal-associated domain-containing protein n=1 Tax=Paenibacillus yanchengensis TaxID=2035833 RepID=A0ABW4YET9_9BACL
MKKVVFQLETLTCPSCINKIESVLSKVHGVTTVKVLFHSSKVRIQFEEQIVTADHLQATVMKLGYPILSSKVS